MLILQDRRQRKGAGANMNYIHINEQTIKASRVILGCMRIADMSMDDLDKLIHASLEVGVNTFDHADIYGGGMSESKFGEVLATQPQLRDQLFLQSKCGIRAGFYDFSKEHILESVDGILQRLHTDYLNLLILHRPDVLMDMEELAEAFEKLASSGKVLDFGVSNMNPMQIELLQKCTKKHLCVNQLQLSAAHTKMIDEAVNVNMTTDGSPMCTGSVMDYCRLRDIAIQSWSSLQYGFFEGAFLGNNKYPKLNAQLDQLAQKYGVSAGAIAIAWILKCPAVKQAVVGTTKPSRIAELAAASEITITRQEWYQIYTSAGNQLP